MMRATMKKSLRSMVLKALRPGNSKAKRSRETIPEIRNEDPVWGPVEPEVLGTEPETRTRTITFKQERLLVISQLRSVESWCQECSATTLRLSQKQAATVTAVSEEEIFRQVEAGQVHRLRPDDQVARVLLGDGESPARSRARAAVRGRGARAAVSGVGGHHA